MHESFGADLEGNAKFFFERTGWDHIVDANKGLHVVHQLSATETTSLLTYVLSECPSIVNLRDANGHTPLHYAVLHGKLESVKLLVRILASINF